MPERDSLLRDGRKPVDSPAWAHCTATCQLQGFRRPCAECVEDAEKAEAEHGD